jgi:hypothetical protein
MKVAIHQPEYWPIPRFLAKWAQADLLVILDTVQFDRGSLQHRCKLASTDGQLRWLTIPFHHNGSRVLRDLVPCDLEWAMRHWRTIREWYRYSDRLDTIEAFYRGLDRNPRPSIADYSESTMMIASDLAAVSTPTKRVTDLTPPDGHWGAKVDLVLNICRAVGATTYLSGRAGYEYLLPATEKFSQAGIAIEIQTYPQAAEVPGLSSLHIYLQHGPTRLRELVTRR